MTNMLKSNEKIKNYILFLDCSHINTCQRVREKVFQLAFAFLWRNVLPFSAAGWISCSWRLSWIAVSILLGAGKYFCTPLIVQKKTKKHTKQKKKKGLNSTIRFEKIGCVNNHRYPLRMLDFQQEKEKREKERGRKLDIDRHWSMCLLRATDWNSIHAKPFRSIQQFDWLSDYCNLAT